MAQTKQYFYIGISSGSRDGTWGNISKIIAASVDQSYELNMVAYITSNFLKIKRIDTV